MSSRRPITILMADDDPDDRQLTKEAFAENHLGNDLRFVEDGEELLDYLNQRGKFAGENAPPLPGLILLDLNMPRKDGREALQEIKADPRFRSIRVVVMTTSKAEEDVVRSYDLSAASYITKPVTFDRLVDVVRTLGKYWLEIVELPPRWQRERNGPHLTVRAAAAPITPATSAESGAVRVLLVDDDRDDYFLTRELLADIPGGRYQLDWTPDYDAGVAAVCGGAHDVFLLDYRLGARTGIELLREAQASGRSGPVILLTGHGKSQTDLDALDAGADDYLEKAGLTPALLERSIRFAVAQHRASAELERKVKERTEELARANAALRDADRRKDEFLATLAHELRNPLAPIRNALEILRLANDSGDAVRRQRERLERQVAQLVRLVEDLLEVSRITTGKLRLSTESLTVQEVMEAALDMSRPQIDKAKLTLTTDIPEKPIPLNGDRVRLTQVFSNLLNNAAKFTEPGGQIWLRARADAGRVTVTVRDTGVGIPEDILLVVFNLFTQVDRSLNRSQGGLGIGLALVHRLVEMHGGVVRAESEGVGKGATFTVTLPTTAHVST